MHMLSVLKQHPQEMDATTIQSIQIQLSRKAGKDPKTQNERYSILISLRMLAKLGDLLRLKFRGFCSSYQFILPHDLTTDTLRCWIRQELQVK